MRDKMFDNRKQQQIKEPHELNKTTWKHEKI